MSTASPGPEGRDRWGTLGIVVVVDNTSAFSHLADEPIAAPASDKSSIFHPPRV
jgi:hypothetical protein